MQTAASPGTRDINRSPRKRQQNARAMANQNATAHLRQSGRLSVRHSYAAKGEFYAQGCIFSNIIFRLFNRSLANASFLLWEQRRVPTTPQFAVDVGVRILSELILSYSICLIV